jgi:hypothetical protein
MNVSRILSAAICGTSAMTLFSYLVSKRKKEQFREPVLLSLLIKRFESREAPKQNIDGWAIHYSVGSMFSAIYDQLWRSGKMKPNITNGAIIGAISGLAGIGGWHATLRFHPDPPPIDIKKYYGHLLAAHIVFGVFAALGYRMTNQNLRSTLTSQPIKFLL